MNSTVARATLQDTFLPAASELGVLQFTFGIQTLARE